MTAVYVLVLLGLALGLIIGLAVKLFGVEIDHRLEAVEELLPGANCGACGFAGCTDFARALIGSDTEPGKCPSCSPDALEKLCELLGVSAGGRTENTAVVMCGGGDDKATSAALYNGVNDCRNAVLVAGGAKGCQYGCLGLASCARACPFGAIETTAERLAVVHADLCTGCGKCVGTCPRHLIQLVPKAAPVHVFCNSPAKGGEKRKVCKAACIGCRKCVKGAEDGQMTIDGFLVRVNYEDPPPVSIAEVCPTKCLLPALQVAEAPVAENEAEVVNA